MVRSITTFTPACANSASVNTCEPQDLSATAQLYSPNCADRTCSFSPTSHRSHRDVYWKPWSPVRPSWGISAYAEDVTSGRGGGAFVPIGDWQALGRKIAELDKNRWSLADLIAKAAENGKRFNDEAVFRERSELISQILLGALVRTAG